MRKLESLNTRERAAYDSVQSTCLRRQPVNPEEAELLLRVIDRIDRLAASMERELENARENQMGGYYDDE